MWAAFRATPAKPIENATRGPAGGGSPLKKRLDAGEVLQPVERKVLNRSPTPEAAAFLTLNGLILLTGELLRRKAAKGAQRRVPGWIPLDYREAAFIGVFQSLALLAGISRSGVSMVGALVRELDHEDAATFAFLLATPVILAAGVDKLPELAGPSAAHIHGQVVVGAMVVAGVAACASLRFLVRYFHTRTLLPFVLYSLLAGVISPVHFA